MIDTNRLQWVDLLDNAHGWGVSLNSVYYGKEKLNMGSIDRVEFELGIPNILVPKDIYKDLCYELTKVSSKWASASGRCNTKI